MISQPEPPGNPDAHPTSGDLRDASRNALVVASRAQRENIARGERILGYYLARSLSYGLTLSEIAEITELDCTEILRLTDPAVCG